MYTNTLIERDKAILLGDEELKKQSEEIYSKKCMMMIKNLRQNEQLINQSKLYFDNNEKELLNKYSDYNGKIVKNINEFIDMINKKDMFCLFGIECERGKIYKSNIIDLNIHKEISCQKKDIREKLIEDFLNKHNIKNSNDKSVTIVENKSMWIIKINRNSYHYIDTDPNSKRIYLYITKGTDNENYIWKYSSFDLYCAVNNYSVSQAIQVLSYKLNISILNINTEKERYLKNINVIEDEFNTYKYLNKIIGKSKNVLIEINKQLSENIYKVSDDNKYIALDYNTIAINVGIKASTISPYINLFCALGLIQKKQLDTNNKKNNQRNVISSFYIGKYDKELLEYANRMSKKLIDNKVTKSKFTASKCLEVFGLEMMEKIFTDKRAIMKAINNY